MISVSKWSYFFHYLPVFVSASITFICQNVGNIATRLCVCNPSFSYPHTQYLYSVSSSDICNTWSNLISIHVSVILIRSLNVRRESVQFKNSNFTFPSSHSVESSFSQHFVCVCGGRWVSYPTWTLSPNPSTVIHQFLKKDVLSV